MNFFYCDAVKRVKGTTHKKSEEEMIYYQIRYGNQRHVRLTDAVMIGWYCHMGILYFCTLHSWGYGRLPHIQSAT